jgi:mannose-6-phosphate isomerase-like protein (cupin superfamily)
MRGPTDQAPLTVAAALEALRETGGEYTTLFRHGTLEIEIYRPVGIDRQQPHRKDEVYVIISGTGSFLRGERRKAFAPGDVLFAPAGAEHRFIDFSGDFATWVFFYGPDGGEAA